MGHQLRTYLPLLHMHAQIQFPSLLHLDRSIGRPARSILAVLHTRQRATAPCFCHHDSFLSLVVLPSRPCLPFICSVSPTREAQAQAQSMQSLMNMMGKGQRQAKATSIYSSPYGRDTYMSIATVVRVPVPSFLPSQTLFGPPSCGSQLPRAPAWAASWSGLAPRGRGQEQDGRARADCRQRRIPPTSRPDAPLLSSTPSFHSPPCILLLSSSATWYKLLLRCNIIRSSKVLYPPTAT